MRAKGTIGKVGFEWVGSSVGVNGDRLGAGASVRWLVQKSQCWLGRAGVPGVRIWEQPDRDAHLHRC